MKLFIDVAIIIISLTSPIWVVYLVLMYIRWEEYRAENAHKNHRAETIDKLKRTIQSNKLDIYPRHDLEEVEHE